MTCIIGVNCEDGAVLAADRRVVRGKEVFNRRKLYTLPEREEKVVAFGFSGLTGIRDKFLPLIKEGMGKAMLTGELEALRGIIHGVEDTIRKIHKRYSPRFGKGEKFTLGAIVGGLKSLSGGRAQLHRLSPRGFAEKITTFNSIGSAGDHANAFLKLLYGKERGVDEIADISILLIRLIEDMDIDRNVGGKPDVIKIKDEEGIKVVPEQEVEDVVERYDKGELARKASTAFREVFP